GSACTPTAETVTSQVTTALAAPSLSMAVTRTVNVPVSVKTWPSDTPASFPAVGSTMVSAAPSPQLTTYRNPAAVSTGDTSVAPRWNVRVWPRTPSSGPSIDVTGGTLLTVMANVFVSKRAGEPLSVTRIVTWPVVGPSPGVHSKAPVTGSMVAPEG